MSNGGVLGRRNVPGVDGFSGVWSLQEIANARRLGVWPPYDTFDSNTIDQYVEQTNVSGVWAISGGEMVATNGSQSVLLRRGPNYADGFVEADINQAQDAGLVVRHASSGAYYVLTLSDDSGATPTQNLRLFKNVSGSFTLLGSTADITWVRGTSKTIRLAAVGDSLSAYVDGALVISATDSTFSAPGSVGMRNNGAGVAKFQALRWGNA